jgi:hypothetical protein
VGRGIEATEGFRPPLDLELGVGRGIEASEGFRLPFSLTNHCAMRAANRAT